MNDEDRARKGDFGIDVLDDLLSRPSLPMEASDAEGACFFDKYDQLNSSFNSFH